jgi:cell division protein ZapE
VSGASSSATPAAAAPSPAPGDLQQSYQRELAQRHFRSDPAQLAAIARLEDLRRRLIAAAPAQRARRPRWLGAFTRRAQRAPVQGLYLWGDVGRGKTWLMDLFFDSVPFKERRRRHFHRFMHEAQLPAVRTTISRSPASTSR